MKSHWIRRAGNRTLQIVAAGWGQDSDFGVRQSWRDDCDVLALFEWDAEGELPPLADYDAYRLLAWSFGVWRAATLAWPIEFGAAIAVNGTLSPVDDLYGIPQAIFAGTLAGWVPEVSAAKFWRRMGAGKGSLPSRGDESLRRELAWFADAFAEKWPFTVTYQRAAVGGGDRIFPPENQLRAWRLSGVPTVELAIPHDPGTQMTEIAYLDEKYS